MRIGLPSLNISRDGDKWAFFESIKGKRRRVHESGGASFQKTYYTVLVGRVVKNDLIDSLVWVIPAQNAYNYGKVLYIEDHLPILVLNLYRLKRQLRVRLPSRFATKLRKVFSGDRRAI